MWNRRTVVCSGLGLGATTLLAAHGWAADAGEIKGATAITRVYGEGQKLTAIAVEYGRDIAGAKLTPASFRVEGRIVTGVYTSSSADPAGRAANGRFVIVELSPQDAGAALKEGRQPGGPGGPPPAGAGSPGRPDGPPGGGMGDIGEKPRDGGPRYRPATATISQTRPIATASGRALAPSAPIVTSAVKNLIVDDFRQLEFRDPASGDTLKYNLFVPKGYDPARTYPLVLFMHDAGATGPDTRTTLRQGLGAVVFASPEEQAKHPCFVLAPQYETIIVNDNSQASSARETTYALIQSLLGQWSVDRGRIYSTGQSGGAMMTIALNIQYPGLFAASWIVAGQWNPALVKPLAQDKLWIVVSQGDLKAYPGENAITAVLEGEGAKVSRAVWDGTWTPAQFTAAAHELEAKGAPIHYVALRLGTVVPPGQPDNGGSNHVNTWRIAYGMEGVRDWLFRQRT